MRHLFIRLVRPRIILAITLLLLLESGYHVNSLRQSRPEFNLDKSFGSGCNNTSDDTQRQNATILMLARNNEVQEALQSLMSLEKQFNSRYHYPVVFLNDKPWSKEFKEAVSNVVSGDAIFEVIEEEMWYFPDWIDETAARKSILDQGEKNIVHAGEESYHHMCRFFSMHFYDHPALQQYKWYWRVEPGIEYTCPMNSDPFLYMEREHKRYGYAIALQEVGSTTTSLFRAVSDWKSSEAIPTSGIWRAIVEASWAPLPFRWMLRWAPYRDASGDEWNLCHFWNNFEIADMDFFRGREYRRFMNYLDELGGFYFERWGDAAVRSLAVALYLKPEQVHYFGDDVCYCHGSFCSDGVNSLSPESACPIEPQTVEQPRGVFNQLCVEKFKKMVTPL